MNGPLHSTECRERFNTIFEVEAYADALKRSTTSAARASAAQSVGSEPKPTPEEPKPTVKDPGSEAKDETKAAASSGVPISSETASMDVDVTRASQEKHG